MLSVAKDINDRMKDSSVDVLYSCGSCLKIIYVYTDRLWNADNYILFYLSKSCSTNTIIMGKRRKTQSM